MSQTTKRAIEASLKKLLLQKPLDKITINDIASDCGISRMTFYYHFQDIYDLIEWCCEEDAKRILQGKKDYGTWQEGVKVVFQEVLENKPFVMNVYHSVGREQIETYLYRMIRPLLLDVINAREESNLVREEDKNFIADFYKYALVGLILEWVRTGMKETPEKIVERLSVVMQGDLVGALNRFRMDRRN